MAYKQTQKTKQKKNMQAMTRIICKRVKNKPTQNEAKHSNKTGNNYKENR